MWHARPRGNPMRIARVLAWHTGDVYLYIYLYIGYSTYKHSKEELANPIKTLTLYTQWFSIFFLCGTINPLSIWFQAAWCDVERWINIGMKGARRCDGHDIHPIKHCARASKIHLSELIATVDLVSYNGGDHSRSVDSLKHHDRWIKIQWRIKRCDVSN